MGKSLKRTVVAGGVVYPAGTAATPELEKRVINPAHWSGAEEPTGYEALTVEQLKAEIDKRNKGRDDDARLTKTGTKAELVTALESDDAS